MTWADVAADAIKIGVPSLLTALTAIFVARGSRSHEFEKERRRRKQDCLERVMEDLDTCQAAATALFSSTAALMITRDASAVQVNDALEDLNRVTDQLALSQNALTRWVSKLSVLGFGDLAAAVEKYDFAISFLHVQMAPVRSAQPGAMEKADEAFKEAVILRNSVRDMAKKAFDSL
jgi:hypothetical protein